MNNLKSILLLSFICTASFSAAILSPAFPIISKQLLLHHGAVSWLMTIFMLGYVFGQLFYGPVANSFGRLFALRLGLVINILGIIVCMFGYHSFVILLIGRFITALGSSAGLVCTFILINELYDASDAKEVMAYTVVAFTVGLAMSVSLGGIVTQYAEWQDCFWVLLFHGACMLWATVIFSETLKVKKPFHPLEIFKHYKRAILNKKLFLFSIILSFVSFMTYGYSTAAPLIAHSLLRLNPAGYGFWNLWNMLGMLSSGILGKILIKKYKISFVFILGFLGMGIVVLSLIAFSYFKLYFPLWFFTTTMLGYFFSGLLFPCAAFYASTALDDKASASAVMNFLNMGGSLLVVACLGYLPFSMAVSYPAVFTLFFIFAACLYFFWGKPFVMEGELKKGVN